MLSQNDPANNLDTGERRPSGQLISQRVERGAVQKVQLGEDQEDDNQG